MAEEMKKKAAKAKVDKTPAKNLKVTLVKSPCNSLQRHKRTVEALGLKKIRSFKILPDNACTRGMLHAVRHLITVEEQA